MLYGVRARCLSFFFFFIDTPTTEIYTLSLHDALPIWSARGSRPAARAAARACARTAPRCAGSAPTARQIDRKSTRLNSSHVSISYAVFCLKKKKKQTKAVRQANTTLDKH